MTFTWRYYDKYYDVHMTLLRQIYDLEIAHFRISLKGYTNTMKNKKVSSFFKGRLLFNYIQCLKVH